MPDPVTRLNAALEGRYRIESKLGEGGMATVYLADDLKHERKVALKVLKPELAAVVGAERFLAEIKTTANLQHPHILPLHDSGEADGLLFYVMPYVEGESLRERLDRDRQLGVDEAIGITTKVAAALQAAHERGVIHRDIKPANILLSRGEPLISDFGIALAVSAGGGDRLTETGLSLGTPHYMSPEQATGDQTVGPATDIYAMGCVLYEMLVGEPPYTGSTPQAILGKIIQAKPVSAKEARRTVPANVDAAIRRSLEKVPADRFTRAQDLVAALTESAFRHGEPSADGRAAHAWAWNRLAVTLAALLAAMTAVTVWIVGTPEEPMPRRAALLLLDVETSRLPDLAPDGSAVAFAGTTAGGVPMIFLRYLDDLTPVLVEGTEGARAAVFSPEGDEIAFVAQRQLKVAPLDGGPVRTLADSVSCCARWGRDGMIYFSGWRLSRASRVPEMGGSVELVAGGPSSSGVQIMDGGETALLESGGVIEAVHLDTHERVPLVEGSTPRVTPTGYLVFGSGAQILAAPFDVDRMALTATPRPLIDGVRNMDGSMFTVSRNGTLVYQRGRDGSGNELVWVTRSGVATPVRPGETLTAVGNMRLSTDEARIVFDQRQLDDQRNLFMKELPDGPPVRLTFDGGTRPLWAPDGVSITFRRNQQILSKRVDGLGEEALEFDRFSVAKAQWSPDNQWLVLRRSGESTIGAQRERAIFAIRPGIDSLPVPLLESRPSETFWYQGPEISPDGRWLAYSSDLTGQPQVFVRPFPDVEAAVWQVSSEGGANPVWARNGRELFFYDPQTRQLSVAEYAATTSSFRAGPPSPLFVLPPELSASSEGNVDFYDYSVERDRFIMVRAVGATEPFVVVQGFHQELERLIPR